MGSCCAGEVTCMAVDPSASLLVCGTTRNNLLAFSLPGGKLLASCKAHLANTAINKVGWGAGCSRVHVGTAKLARGAGCTPSSVRITLLSWPAQLDSCHG